MRHRAARAAWCLLCLLCLLCSRAAAPAPRTVKALHDWNEAAGASADDLHFARGDTIELLSERPGHGWFTGRLGDAKGTFPSNRVEAPPPSALQKKKRKGSKRAERLAAKKRAAESFHGSAGGSPWQVEASSMPEGWNGRRVAKEMEIPSMLDRIVGGWPGAHYVSERTQFGPGVIAIDDFISDEEAEHMIQIGDEAGLEGSSGTGAKQADGSFKREHTDYRTSLNSWLMGKFMTDPTVRTIDARIGNLTGLFEGNSEHYQVLRYTGEGDEYYKVRCHNIGSSGLHSSPDVSDIVVARRCIRISSRGIWSCHQAHVCSRCSST